MSRKPKFEEVKDAEACESTEESPEKPWLNLVGTLVKACSREKFSTYVPVVGAVMAAYGCAVAALRVGDAGRENTYHVSPGVTTQTQKICGVIQDAGSASVIPLAVVSASNAAGPAVSDTNGEFCIRVISNNVGDETALRVSKKGYGTTTLRVVPPIPTGITVVISKTERMASILPRASAERKGSTTGQGNCMSLNVDKQSPNGADPM